MSDKPEDDDPEDDDFDGPVITNPNPNSQAAAKSMKGYAKRQRRHIWLLIRDSPDGLACWEVEQALGMLHQSASAAINWLLKYDWLERTGDKNLTPSNRKADIYVARWGKTP